MVTAFKSVFPMLNLCLQLLQITFYNTNGVEIKQYSISMYLIYQDSRYHL